MANQGRRAQDDRRNQAKIRGQKAIIWGQKPKLEWQKAKKRVLNIQIGGKS